MFEILEHDFFLVLEPVYLFDIGRGNSLALKLLNESL